MIDPKTHTVSELDHPVRDPNTSSSKSNPFEPSAFWRPTPISDGKTLSHNPIMDEPRRVWFTSRIRPNANPDFCKSGSSHPSAKVFPLNGEANRHLSMYDPASGKWTWMSTCFTTHHLNFAYDSNHTLRTSPGVVGPGEIGWLNRRLHEETGGEVRSHGWSPHVLDINGEWLLYRTVSGANKLSGFQ